MTRTEAHFYRDAVRKGNLDEVKVFFKDFDSKSKEDQDYLIFSGVTEVTSVKMLQHLISLGIPLDYVDEEKQNTLLHLAACSDYPEIPAYFIKKKLDVNARNVIGATPLMFGACYTSNPKVLKTLINAGADITITDNDDASILCIASRYSESEEIINFLTEQGLDIEHRDSSGLTPLLSAARYNSSLDIILALRDAGADLYAKSPDGDNALHLAALNNDCSKGMIDALRTRFRSSDTNDRGYTPLSLALFFSENTMVINALIQSQRDELLYEACQNRSPNIVSVLKINNIDLNHQTSDYRYPVMLVAKFNNNPAVLEEMIKAGAILEVRDLWGRTVLHYAAMNEDASIYEWLKEQDSLQYLDVEDDDGNKAEYYRQKPEEF